MHNPGFEVLAARLSVCTHSRKTAAQTALVAPLQCRFPADKAHRQSHAPYPVIQSSVPIFNKMEPLIGKLDAPDNSRLIHRRWPWRYMMSSHPSSSRSQITADPTSISTNSPRTQFGFSPFPSWLRFFHCSTAHLNSPCCCIGPWLFQIRLAEPAIHLVTVC
jgi:hypothetical protein